MSKFKILDIFSGIGGFSLGLQRTNGFETVAFCEIDPFCRRVLAKHWPKVPCYDDIRSLTADALARDRIGPIDVICGGFPCQDISFAGRRAGLEGARSGLWGEYRRLIGEIRPRFVVVENVPGLLSLGMGTVLGDLSEIGYNAVWDSIPASAVGAPHQRDRLWIVAYSQRIAGELQRKPGDVHGARLEAESGRAGCARQTALSARHGGENAAYANGQGQHAVAVDAEVAGAPQSLANSDNGHEPERTRPAWWRARQRQAIRAQPRRCGQSMSLAGGEGLALWQGPPGQWPYAATAGSRWWDIEPPVDRVADGVPSRVDRLRSLGNAVIPQIPEILGRVILAASTDLSTTISSGRAI